MIVVGIYVWLLIANLAAHRFRTLATFGHPVRCDGGCRTSWVWCWLVPAWSFPTLSARSSDGPVISSASWGGLACRSTLLLAAKVFTDREKR